MRIGLFVLAFLTLTGCASTFEKNKAKADLYLQMGVSQLQSGNYPFALRDLLKANEYNPNDPVIHNNLGLVYFARERFDLAEQAMKKAIELDPQFTEARNNLARVLLERGKYQESEKQLKLVIQDLTYPSPEKAFINLGLVKFNQKNFPEAVQSFKKVTQSTPEDCIANTYIGRSFFESEEYSQAIEALDRAIGFCQKNLYDEPHYYSALAYYRTGEKSKSVARFEEILKYYPNGKYREKAKGMLSLIRKGH